MGSNPTPSALFAQVSCLWEGGKVADTGGSAAIHNGNENLDGRAGHPSTLGLIDYRIVVGSPKTDAGWRAVSLDDATVAALRLTRTNSLLDENVGTCQYAAAAEHRRRGNHASARAPTRQAHGSC